MRNRTVVLGVALPVSLLGTAVVRGRGRAKTPQPVKMTIAEHPDIHMRLPIATAMALTAALAAAGPAIDLTAAPKPINPVTITFADDAAHNIKSDGQAYEHGIGGVIAYLDATTGHLNFSSGSSDRGRTLQFSFGDCVASCLGAPFQSGYAAARIQAGVRSADGTKLPGGLLGMSTGPGGALRSGVNLSIPVDNDPAYWTLCMTPSNADGFCAISNSSTTVTPAHIVRNASDLWTITAAADDSDVGELWKQVSSGKNRGITLHGAYSMPFSFTVQCLNSNCS